MRVYKSRDEAKEATKRRLHIDPIMKAFESPRPLTPIPFLANHLCAPLLLFPLLLDELLGCRLGLVEAPGLDLALEQLVKLGRRATD